MKATKWVLTFHNFEDDPADEPPKAVHIMVDSENDGLVLLEQLSKDMPNPIMDDDWRLDEVPSTWNCNDHKDCLLS